MRHRKMMKRAPRHTIPSGLSLLLALSLWLAWMVPASGAGLGPHGRDRVRAVDKALRWLYAQQNGDGGFGNPGSELESSCGVVLAFAAAYEDPTTVQTSGRSPLDYLATQDITDTQSTEAVARAILAVVAGNEDPTDFDDSNLIASLNTHYDPSTGRYGAHTSDGTVAQALAIMALQASFESIPPEAIQWLKEEQNPDGGWGPASGGDSNTLNASLSLQALIAAGEPPGSQAILDGVDFLRARQNSDAGFASSPSVSVSDAASTSQAIQALLAVGENLLSGPWTRCARTPFDYLLDVQASNGSFGDDLAQTYQAVPGILGRPLPVPGRRMAALKALEWLRAQQDGGDGGFGGGGTTADAVFAIARCGQDPSGPDWTTDGDTSAWSALQSQAEEYIDQAQGDEPAGELGKVIRAVQAAQEVGVSGADPYDFAGIPLVEELTSTYTAETGRYHPSKLYSHNLAVLALEAVGESIPNGALAAIEEDQHADGGWSWGWDGDTSDVDTTGRSMQALVAGGRPVSSTVRTKAVDFLQSVQFSDGGFPDVAGRSEANCNSTALAIQGLLAMRRYRDQPLLFATDKGELASSWDALLAFQEPGGEDSGSFRYSAGSTGSRLLATLNTIPVLVSSYYPGYQPLSEGDETIAGVVSSRVTCGSGIEIVAPYEGDDNDNGSATLRYRPVGEEWSTPTTMDKAGLAYRWLLELQVGTKYQVEVTYQDPEGITGVNPQTITVQPGTVYIPLTLRSYPTH